MDLYFLRPKRAMRIISKKQEVQTIRMAGKIEMRKPMRRSDVSRLLQIFQRSIVLAGPVAQENGFGIAVKDSYGYLFLETDPVELEIYQGKIVR
jgi:hypothetical protein